jgi:hypothetical protein
MSTSDEIGAPPTPIAKPGIATPPDIHVERKEGRIGSFNESVGGEVAPDRYTNSK